MNKPMYVQPKLAQLRLKVTRVGGVTSPSSSSTTNKNQEFVDALNKLDAATQNKITAYLGYTTIYSSYPCKDNVDDWKNFVKYAVIKGDYASLDAYSLVWSATTAGNTTTYTPEMATRTDALETYNEYVADAGATTGVKPACAAVQDSYVKYPQASFPYNNLV
jgi:hypothetical protein